MPALLLHAHQRQLMPVFPTPQRSRGSRPQKRRRHVLCRADAATRSLEQAVRVGNSTIVDCEHSATVEAARYPQLDSRRWMTALTH